MNHLEMAKDELIASEGADLHWQEKYLQSAQAHALVAICERLDRLIECQVVRVPILGSVSDGGKVTIWEGE